MGVMSLGIYRGENVKIKITGPDQEKAMEGIVNFLTSEGLGRLV
jgi:phosphocarrier protein